MATNNIAGNAVFGIECDNDDCTEGATVDVDVLDASTGETVRDLATCPGCEDAVRENVPDGYVVVARGGV